MILNNDWLNNRIIVDVRTYVSIISLKTDETTEDCVQIVKYVLAELGATLNIKFLAIHCLRKPETASEESTTSQDTEGQSRPRPIVVRFFPAWTQIVFR